MSWLPKKAEALARHRARPRVHIDSGELDLYLRYWPDKRYYAIKFNEASGFETGEAPPVTIRIKGSTITLARPGKPSNSDTMAIATSRTGGIGFGLNSGSKVTISKLNVKVLR